MSQRWNTFAATGKGMLILYLLTALLLGVSLVLDRGKTGRALRIALRRFLRILPAFLVMLVLIAVVLYLLPDRFMTDALARQNKWSAIVGAIGIGSVSVMPGFIAFPLCGILYDKGALYMVLSAFSTTLMMVGIVTFPLEKSFLGGRLALWRNILALVTGIAVALATGFYFGEIP